MSEHRAKLNAYGHPDVVVTVADPLDSVAAWLPEWFVDRVAARVQFAAGQTLEVGWSLLKLAARDGEATEGAAADGELVLLEPDFAAMPTQWVAGASETVRTLAVQRAVCGALGVEPDFPSLRQALQIPTAHPWRDLGRFAMGRHADNPEHAPASDSGWAFAAEPDATFTRISLYEAALSNRAIVPFLALPPGAWVARDGRDCEVRCGGRAITSRDSDLLAGLLRGLDAPAYQPTNVPH